MLVWDSDLTWILATVPTITFPPLRVYSTRLPTWKIGVGIIYLLMSHGS